MGGSRVENRTTEPISVEQVSWATWNLTQGTNYQLRYLTGRWAGEWNLEQQPIHPGKTVLESRRGSTGAQNNPWFAIERGVSSDEDNLNNLKSTRNMMPALKKLTRT